MHVLGESTKRESESISEETRLKRAALQSKVPEKEKTDKIDRKFDSYTTKKGTDSNLAVVHIDGNNMGLRIRALIEDIHNYEKAVNQMREISFNINQGYKSVFDEMSDYFNRFGIVYASEEVQPRWIFVRAYTAVLQTPDIVTGTTVLGHSPYPI